MYTLTLIPGDGIGPEVTQAAVEVMEAAGVKINWETAYIGESALREYDTTLPDDTLRLIEKNKYALKGPVTTPVGKGFKSVNVGLRQSLDLYTNLRPIKAFPGLPALHPLTDLVIVRENTEDLYTGIEHRIGDFAAESIKLITRSASERIARFAFEYALMNNRKKVTAVHKANIMKLSDGLFLQICREVAEDYKDIEFSDCIIDSLCMQLVMYPQKFDVLVLPNLYGDIVSDLGAGLVGGLGLVPGANIGSKGAVFEAVHGSAPDIAGQDLADPIAVILSGAMLLDHMGESSSAQKIRTAISLISQKKEFLTRDLGGNSGTKQFTEYLCETVYTL